MYCKYNPPYCLLVVVESLCTVQMLTNIKQEKPGYMKRPVIPQTAMYSHAMQVKFTQREKYHFTGHFIQNIIERNKAAFVETIEPLSRLPHTANSIEIKAECVFSAESFKLKG